MGRQPHSSKGEEGKNVILTRYGRDIYKLDILVLKINTDKCLV